MDPYWTFARSMLRYRGLIAATIVMVLVSSVTLGIGLLGAKPVLEAILGEAQGLDRIAQDFNAQIKENVGEFAPWAADMLTLSPGAIARLPAEPFASLIWIMLALCVLTVIGGTSTFLHSYFAQTVVNRTVTAVRRQAFHTVLRSPLKALVAAGPTDAISRIVNDSGVLANGLHVLLSKAVLQVAKGIAGLAIALICNWKVTLVALLVTPLLYHVIRKLGKRIKRSSNATLQSQAGLYAAASESLQSLRVVKVHTTERYEAGRFHRMNKQMLEETNRVRTAKALASPLTETLTIFMLCGMVLVLGKLIIDGKVEASGFILAVASLAVAGASLRPLTGIMGDIQSSTPAAARLAQLLATPPEPGHPRRGERLTRLARHSAGIVIENVRLTYPGAERPALDGVSLTVPHAKQVAIVGGNGSGKTTLLALVPRLFDPDEGRVLVDGVDLRTVNVRSLREQIGVVTQEVTIFRGTIRSNILYGTDGAVTEEVMLRASKAARAHDFITALPQGYDTPVAEQGLNLSGGQRQRLAITRAILRNPAIVILDEATSMIDAESEAQIGAAIAEFCTGRTCLIVAHRLSTVLRCDSIVVMEAGKIVDQGTHQELMSRCDAYRVLARHQLGVGSFTQPELNSDAAHR